MCGDVWYLLLGTGNEKGARGIGSCEKGNAYNMIEYKCGVMDDKEDVNSWEWEGWEYHVVPVEEKLGQKRSGGCLGWWRS